jgi:hypothetical protein
MMKKRRKSDWTKDHIDFVLHQLAPIAAAWVCLGLNKELLQEAIGKAFDAEVGLLERSSRKE